MKKRKKATIKVQNISITTLALYLEAAGLKPKPKSKTA